MFIAHLPAGYLVTRALQGRLKTTGYIRVGLLASVLPDADLFYFYLVDHRQTLHHEYWIHLPVFWLSMWLALLAVNLFAKSRKLFFVSTIFLANICLHLVLDTFAAGIAWLSPFSHASFVLVEVPARYPSWIASYILHWTFLVELAIVAWAVWAFLKDRMSSSATLSDVLTPDASGRKLHREEPMKIILGSQSKGRSQVLSKAGLEFDTLNADIDEKAIRDEDPEKLVLALAHAKADVLLKRITEPALLITVDQVAVCDGRIREKPEDKAEARAFLESYAVHPAEVVTGVVVTNTQTGKQAEGLDRARVYYEPSLLSVIDGLIAKGEVMESAGSFIAEDPLMLAHVKKMEGGEDSFIGMPLALVKRLLAEAEAG